MPTSCSSSSRTAGPVGPAPEADHGTCLFSYSGRKPKLMALQCGRCNGYESDDLAKHLQWEPWGFKSECVRCRFPGTRQPGAALSAEFRRCIRNLKGAGRAEPNRAGPGPVQADPTRGPDGSGRAGLPGEPGWAWVLGLRDDPPPYPGPGARPDRTYPGPRHSPVPGRGWGVLAAGPSRNVTRGHERHARMRTRAHAHAYVHTRKPANLACRAAESRVLALKASEGL